MRPSGPTASATLRTAFLLNGVDASNLFNGKSTSQVSSARVINSTGVQTSPGGGGGVIPSAASVYLSIGNAIPTPAPETIAEVRVNASMYDATAGLNLRRAHRHEHRVRHQHLSRHRSTCTAAPTGSTPRHSSSSRIRAFRRTTRFRNCIATSLGGAVGGPHHQGQALRLLSPTSTCTSRTRRSATRSSMCPSASATTVPRVRWPTSPTTRSASNIGNPNVWPRASTTMRSSCSIHLRCPANPASG